MHQVITLCSLLILANTIFLRGLEQIQNGWTSSSDTSTYLHTIFKTQVPADLITNAAYIAWPLGYQPSEKTIEYMRKEPGEAAILLQCATGLGRYEQEASINTVYVPSELHDICLASALEAENLFSIISLVNKRPVSSGCIAYWRVIIARHDGCAESKLRTLLSRLDPVFCLRNAVSSDCLTLFAVLAQEIRTVRSSWKWLTADEAAAMSGRTCLAHNALRTHSPIVDIEGVFETSFQEQQTLSQILALDLAESTREKPLVLWRQCFPRVGSLSVLIQALNITNTVANDFYNKVRDQRPYYKNIIIAAALAADPYRACSTLTTMFLQTEYSLLCPEDACLSSEYDVYKETLKCIESKLIGAKNHQCVFSHLQLLARHYIYFLFELTNHTHSEESKSAWSALGILVKHFSLGKLPYLELKLSEEASKIMRFAPVWFLKNIIRRDESLVPHYKMCLQNILLLVHGIHTRSDILQRILLSHDEKNDKVPAERLKKFVQLYDHTSLDEAQRGALYQYCICRLQLGGSSLCHGVTRSTFNELLAAFWAARSKTEHVKALWVRCKQCKVAFSFAALLQLNKRDCPHCRYDFDQMPPQSELNMFSIIAPQGEATPLNDLVVSDPVTYESIIVSKEVASRIVSLFVTDMRKRIQILQRASDNSLHYDVEKLRDALEDIVT